VQFWSESIEKQIGERVMIALRDPVLLKVFEKFGPETFRRSSVFHGLDKFLRECEVRGNCCFEIGTWNGLTAVVLSRFFEQVITVDVAHNAMKHEVLEHLGIRNVTCIDITSNSHKADLARNIDFDFAFMDGDHANDTASDWALVRRCGRVLFHEVWPWQDPVFALVHSLPRREVRQGGCGLALWESNR
jgi:hypothetical protein